MTKFPNDFASVTARSDAVLKVGSYSDILARMKHGLSGLTALVILFSALLTLGVTAPQRVVAFPSAGSGEGGTEGRACPGAQAQTAEAQLCVRPDDSGELRPARKDGSRGNSRFAAPFAVLSRAESLGAWSAAVFLSQQECAPSLHKYMLMTVLRQSLF